MEVIQMAVMGAVNILCFMIGAKVGQAVSRGKEVELPSPAKAVREHKERKEADREKSKIDTILRNIDNYNGTAEGQEEVPR
jgi:hypothetical protein